MFWAVQANAYQLLKCTNADKAHSVCQLLETENGKRMSAVDIANAAGVTPEMVRSYRRQMESRISNQGLIGSTSVAMTMSFVSTDTSAAREKRPTHRGFSLQGLDTSGYISGHDMPSFDGHGTGMEILSGRAKTAHRRHRASPSTARSWVRRLPTPEQQAGQAADWAQAAGAAMKTAGGKLNIGLAGLETVLASMRAGYGQEAFPSDLDDLDRAVKEARQVLERTRILGQALAAVVEKAVGYTDQPDWRDRRAVQRKTRATVIRRKRKALADELRGRGVRDPVARAEKEIAEREGFANGPALNRWLRRNP